MLCAGITVFARVSNVTDTLHRLRVGVVLSGGGAKGVAHIGVLKLLEEKGVSVDYVVGTSIGSIIGGLYALGYDANTLDSLVRSQDWEFLMNDLVTRRGTPFRDKIVNQKCVLTIPFMDSESFENERQRRQDGEKRTHGRKGILNNIPSALVQGQNLESLFTKFSVGYQDDIDFNELPIPFACVAVDLNTREEVVFRSGNIVTAIRASMSIPGYFAPVKMGNRFLVDGGMINNFPVDVAHQMGADIVIGVDLHEFDKIRTKDVENLGDMVGSMLSIMNGHKYNSGREDADIVISPNTGAYGILAFDPVSVSALVDSGYVAAKRRLAFLDSLAFAQNRAKKVEESSFDGPLRSQRNRPRAINIEQDSVFITQVSSSGASPREMDWLLERTPVKPGMYLDGEKLEKTINYLYESQAFNKVRYSIAGRDSSYNLKFDFTPANQHQLGIGFRFDTREMAELFFHVGFFQHKLFGFKSNINMRLSYYPYFEATAGYTIRNRSSFEMALKYYLSGVNYFGESSTYFQKKTQYGIAELTYNTPGLSSSLFRLGLRLDGYAMTMDENIATGETSGWRYSPMADFRMDTFDDPYFPCRGVKMDASVSYYLNNLRSSDYLLVGQFLDSRFSVQAAIPIGHSLVIMPHWYFRWISNEEAPVFYNNLVGGYIPHKLMPWHIPFVGLNSPVVAWQCASVTRLDFVCNLTGNHYVKAIANMLHTEQNPKEMIMNWTHNKDLFLGYALGYYYKSFIGPISLNLQWSDRHPQLPNMKRFSVFLSLGYDF